MFLRKPYLGDLKFPFSISTYLQFIAIEIMFQMWSYIFHKR